MSKPLPPPDKPPEHEKPAGSWVAIILLLLVGIVAYIGLVFLTLGFFGPILIIVGVLFGIVLFHYVVWGWWLEKIIRQASEEDDG